MIDDLQKQFHSMLKALDIFYVIKGLKPVSRIIINEIERDQKIEFLTSLDLKIAVSDFKIDSELEEDKGFTNKGTIIDEDKTKNGKQLIYLSKDINLAEKSKKLEVKMDHELFGISLGYPKCCSKFFSRNFPIESKRYNDYTLQALDNSDGFKFPYKNNFAIRNFDLALISHFPCNFNCEESQKIADVNLAEIQKDDEAIAKILDGMLKGSVLYTEENGVFFLRGTKLDNTKLFYRTVMASSDNLLTKKIRHSAFLEIINKNKVKIDNNLIDGEYGFMIFM